VEKRRELTFMTPANNAYGFPLILPGLSNWWKRCRQLGLVALALSWTLPVVPSLQAQSSPTEYEVKATYLYNFGRFTEWPNKEWPTRATAPSGGAFTICVLGQDPFGQALNATLAGETINGTNTVAARISKPQEAVNCRILFISSSEDSQLKQILGALEGTSVLTVSDMPQFSQRGGMVQFILDGKKVRFEVNLTPVKHAHLTLSSQLLKVAVNLRRSAQLGD
jgi:hypothetical protein